MINLVVMICHPTQDQLRGKHISLVPDPGAMFRGLRNPSPLLNALESMLFFSRISHCPDRQGRRYSTNEYDATHKNRGLDKT
ncbi:hypothetical protein [Synechocystis salina]|uniref:Uncharacterized protein n=1 Tax=Synechocystis salina LEGE 00031 TaxID=1828736 RepID=A0ABR9VUQ8_9SYNC|nr:hypothetical protein [Synechocystis salina]MBE9242485.1 hypothetical protein [Synechocystis salina LEGE 00041]MBE9254628.1 hypothetical protein [Synechocystis salina LEGE 00031]